ncbi:MAG: RnfABCDGE type electron transport complex subunit D [Treponema sp.]|uniref:RnfABCDGE type electron transport complex subunit D n=1 Tax=Treponema sp. TaxID=166 RepID=UPI001B08E579|nr:RnfABCDGE type electron transport complex subunit D [Treponema sp.]MBO6218904.1 RnfABCDGE type electron transport complex subunit D [Treponema sp.]MBQ8680545.1 RnfABCDGE type electron transport complex subunit D [Treponema sp.]
MKNNEHLYSSVFLSPFSYLRPSVRTEAYIVLSLLLLQLVMLFVTKSFASVGIVLSSLLASYAVDFINKEKNYRSSFVIMASSIRGLMIGLMLPSGFPPLAVFFVSFSVLFFNKYTLGGFANSWVNPVALTVAVCWFIGTSFFPSVEIPFETLQSKNIALSLIKDGTFPLNSFDVAVTNFLNKRLFAFFGVSIPEGYFSLLWDSHANIPAFRFNLLTLLSSIILLGTDVLPAIIPGVFLLTYGLLVKVALPFFYSGTVFQGDVILALLSSGTLFCTFFMLQWHGTTPFTNRGKTLYGLFAGILAFFILGIGLSPAGYVFIILVTNIFSLFVQSVENHFFKEYTASVLLEQAKAVREGFDA